MHAHVRTLVGALAELLVRRGLLHEIEDCLREVAGREGVGLGVYFAC